MARLCILGPDDRLVDVARDDAAAFEALFGDDVAIRGWRDAGDLTGFALVMPLLSWGITATPRDGWPCSTRANEAACASPTAFR